MLDTQYIEWYNNCKSNVLRGKRKKMQQSGKKGIEKFNLFEKVWLMCVIALLSIFLIFFPEAMFENSENGWLVACSVISVISSPICEILISKQSRYWTVFSLFFVELTDIAVLFGMKLYSSGMISLFFWIPFDILTFFRWSGKNIDEKRFELTKVQSFSWKQDALIAAGLICLGIGLGNILSHTGNAAQPYVVAFSNIFEIANGIFLLCRRNEQWLAWFGYLLCEVFIWISLRHYIMLLTVAAMMINTVYGFEKWRRYIRKNRSTAH